jgi:PAS domain S-box-containing protein
MPANLTPGTGSPPLDFHASTLAMNEALMLGVVRQHELTEASESLNARLRAEISERQQAQQELYEKARLLDLSNDAIIVRDMGGRILYWNHGAEVLFGWSCAEALGKVVHTMLRTEFPEPEDQVIAKLRRNKRWTGELVNTTRDGRCLTVLARKALDFDSQGNPVAVLEIITDITDRKLVEQALLDTRNELAERASQLEQTVTERTSELTATNSQLEAFVYTIAHDLRAPLRAMQGFSAMLIDEAGAGFSETGRDYADRINKSAQFMDALLSDLLDFSRISQQRIELTPINLKAVVDSVLSRLEKDIQEKNARVETPGPWPAVLAHEPTLHQVLFNLVSNALKFVKPRTAELASHPGIMPKSSGYSPAWRGRSIRAQASVWQLSRQGSNA